MPEMSVQDMIIVDQGMTTLLYGYLLCDDCEIVMDAQLRRSYRSALTTRHYVLNMQLQWHSNLFWKILEP